MPCAPRMSRASPVRLQDRRLGAGRRRPWRRRCQPGEAVRIFTGAPLPDGRRHDRHPGGYPARRRSGAGARRPRPRGRYVRRAGLDFGEGDLGLAAGKRLTARDIGLAAAMNRPWLRVHRRPRVGDPLHRRRDRHAGRARSGRTRSSARTAWRSPPSVAACGGRCRYRPRQRPRRSRRRCSADRRRDARRRPAGHHRRRLGRRARSGARACSASRA